MRLQTTLKKPFSLFLNLFQVHLNPFFLSSEESVQWFGFFFFLLFFLFQMLQFEAREKKDAQDRASKAGHPPLLSPSLVAADESEIYYQKQQN